MSFKTIIKLAIAFTAPIAFAFGETSSNSPAYKIGVIQTIEHPALDQNYQGIRDELTNQGFTDTLQWDWDSAQFNQSLAIQIAQKFVSQGVTLIIALGTMASQAALSAASSKNIPVIFASVTDPKSAKLTGNIAGTSNFVPVEKHFDLIKQILPTKKRIGIIYNPGDINSVTLMDQMQGIASQKGFELVPATVTKTSEIPGATQSLVGKVDAILVNNDNTALAAFDGIAQVCRENKIPLFASDTEVLPKGALAVRGPNQYALGRQTGRMVAKVLQGKAKISNLGTEYPEKVETYLNEKVAQESGATFPDALKAEAVKNEGGSL